MLFTVAAGRLSGIYPWHQTALPGLAAILCRFSWQRFTLDAELCPVHRKQIQNSRGGGLLKNWTPGKHEHFVEHEFLCS